MSGALLKNGSLFQNWNAHKRFWGVLRESFDPARYAPGTPKSRFAANLNGSCIWHTMFNSVFFASTTSHQIRRDKDDMNRGGNLSNWRFSPIMSICLC
jgi:hypothetical protein